MNFVILVSLLIYNLISRPPPVVDMTLNMKNMTWGHLVKAAKAEWVIWVVGVADGAVWEAGVAVDGEVVAGVEDMVVDSAVEDGVMGSGAHGVLEHWVIGDRGGPGI